MESVGEILKEYCEPELATEGDYKTEDEAKADFELAVRSTQCFNVYKEIDCWYFGGSVFGDKPTGRIDFVLTPRPQLIGNGWVNGCVGVEVKKSGHKVGPMICQMIDYSKAVFRLPESSGCSLVCMSAIVAFPSFKAKGAIQSIMANNRIGVASFSPRSFQFTMGGANIFWHGSNETKVKPFACGYKNGSR
jgi:hypothetical protein